MSEQANTCVFTTMRFDGKSSVAHYNLHLKRLQEHAFRVGIKWPKNAEKIANEAIIDEFSNHNLPVNQPGLIRLELNYQGFMQAKIRAFSIGDGDLSCVRKVTSTALPAPQWNDEINGCKHGDWKPYHDAMDIAKERNCEIALLIKEDTVLDCNSSTPLLLDDDGVAWYPNVRDGSVESISLISMLNGLKDSGIPICQGRITKTLLSRGRELVAVGTGISVVQITHIDGQLIGDGSTTFSKLCHNIYVTQLKNSWHQIQEARK